MTMQARHYPVRLLVIAPVLLALQACGDSDSDYNFEASQAEFEDNFAAAAPAQALFDPTAQVIPFPNNLLFTGSEDGTLNIPVEDAEDAADPIVALNQMDGFSTVAPISTTFSKAISPESVLAGSTARMFQVTTSPEGAVTGIVRELGTGEFAATAAGPQLVLLPVVPLESKTQYLVVLTNGITGANDSVPVSRSLIYGLTAGEDTLTNPQLEGLRLLTSTQLGAVAGAGVTPADVVLSWTFRTQSIREPLQAAKDLVTAQPLVVAPAGLNTMEANEQLQGKADVWIGTLDLPYYQTAADPADPATFAAALAGIWRNAADLPVGPTDFTPVATATVTVPVLMTVPNATSQAGIALAAAGATAPEGGWPVTIFQHGIPRNRLDMLAIADAYADAGRVVFSIDQPMHGIVDTASRLYVGNTPFEDAVERTFDIDVANNETGAPGPDGAIDASGSYFYNLQNLANSRDNLRQAAADLMTLSASLGGAVVPDGAGAAVPIASAGVPLNVGDKNLLGFSLGGISGTTMLSYDDSFQSATIAMAGGGVAQLLANSESFGPSHNAGLAPAGIEVGSADYAQFLLAVQTVIDSGDPINHAATLAAAGVPALHMMEVIGDETVPNSVPAAPLSGSTPLARILGLQQVDSNAAGSALVRFTAGKHSSLISPEASLAVTVEMQREAATFAATQGTQLPITDTSVIETVGAAP